MSETLLQKWNPSNRSTSVKKSTMVSSAGDSGGIFGRVWKQPDIVEALRSEEEKLAKGSGGSDSSWHVQNLDQRRKLIKSKAWELSFLPVKSLFMNVVMMYMTGTGGGIFSVIILAYAVQQAVRNLLNVNRAFDELEGSGGVKINTSLQRLVYTLCGAGILAFFIHQASKMGFIPTGEIDYDRSPSPLLTREKMQIPHQVLLQ